MRLSRYAAAIRPGGGSFLRGVAIITGGSAIAQALPVLLTPVLTRLYAPDDMGVLALYIAFLSLLPSVMTLGYAPAIVSAEDDGGAAQLVALSMLLVVPVAVVATAALWVLKTGDLLGFGAMPGAAVIAAFVSLVLGDAFITLRYWLIRHGAYAGISRAVVGQSVGRMATQIGVGLVWTTWVGLVLGEIVGRGAGLRGMWRASRQGVMDHVAPLRADRIREVASRYRRFPTLSMPSTLIGNLAVMLPAPMIASRFDVAAAGQYAIAMRVMVVPLALVGASVADVFHNRIARLARETPDRSLRFFLAVSGGLFLAGVLPMVIVMAFGERLFPFVLGDQWTIAGQLAAAIAPWALAQLVVSPVSRVVFVFDGQALKLTYDALNLIGVVTVFWVGGNRDWSLMDTIRLLSLVEVVLFGIYFLLLLQSVRRGTARAV